MHGTFKKSKTSEATPALQEKKCDTPDFIGRYWWLFKAMHNPEGDPLKGLLSSSSQ